MHTTPQGRTAVLQSDIPPDVRHTHCSLQIQRLLRADLRIPVNGEHPEVRTRVRDAIEKARQQPVELDVNIYLEAVRAAVEEVRVKANNTEPNALVDYIIDGLPVKSAVWAHFKETSPESLPCSIVALGDDSENHEFLLKRWFALKLEDFAGVEHVLSDETTEPGEVEDTESQLVPTESLTEDDPASAVTFLPPEGKQRETAVSRLKEFDKEFDAVCNLFKDFYPDPNGPPVDTIKVNINDLNFEEMRDAVIKYINRPFQVTPVEVTQGDLEEMEEEETAAFEEAKVEDEFGEDQSSENEEEEEAGTDEETGEAEENEEDQEPEVDPSRNLNKNLGSTSYFCPVSLHDYWVLRAGSPDCGAMHEGQIYYFSNEEARSKFMADPEAVLQNTSALQLPPPRVLLLGVTGSGKTLHGSHLAKALGVFLLNFEYLLQEAVMSKVGHKVGKQYADEIPVPELVLPPLEDAESPTLMNTYTGEKISSSPDGVTEREVDFTENETNVMEYLTNALPLPQDTLEWLLGKFWTTEPYKSTGFVLDGFPTSVDQMQFLLDNNYYPELAVVLEADVEEVTSRLLPVRLDLWRKRNAQKLQNAAALREWKQNKKDLLMQRKRNELVQQLREKRANAQANKSEAGSEGDDGESLEDEADIDELLAAEQAEDEEEIDDEEEEEEAEVIERLKEEISERYDENVEGIEGVTELLEEALIPKVDISAVGRITWVRYRLVKRLTSFVENRASLFERVYPVTPKIAERLLTSSYYFTSRFGRWCPVSQYNRHSWLPPPPVPQIRVPNANVIGVIPGIPEQTLPTKKNLTCAAVYKDEVYWFANPAFRTAFMKNPVKYVKDQPDPPVTIPLRLAILGPPKSGKSTVTRRLVSEFHIPSLTAGDAIRWLLRDPSHAFTRLAEQIREQITSGQAVSDIFVASALQKLLMNSAYCTRGAGCLHLSPDALTKSAGLLANNVDPVSPSCLLTTRSSYILDGYPVGGDQVKLLSTHLIRPSVIIELTCNSEADREELAMRCMQDHEESMALRVAAAEAARRSAEEETREGIDMEELDKEETAGRPEDGFQRPEPEVDVATEFAIKMAVYENAMAERRNWLATHQGILVDLPAIQNRWQLWRRVCVLIKHRMEHLQKYMAAIQHNKPASIAELGIEEWQLAIRSGEYRQYCPVRLNDHQELYDAGSDPYFDPCIRLYITGNSQDQTVEDPKDANVSNKTEDDSTSAGNMDYQEPITINTTLRFAAEYKGRYYRMAGVEELKHFLADPDSYLPPRAAHELPSLEKLPTRLSPNSAQLKRDAFPTQMALRGYCPVCFVLGKKRYEAIRLGLPEFVVCYDGQVHSMCSETCLLQFMRKPFEFVDLKLPKKIPPIVSPVVENTLPLPGYVEQTLSIALREALSRVGQERPKFPFLTIKRSALIYVALHLKAFNPRSPEYQRKRYQEKLNEYLDTCLLPKWLIQVMPTRFQPEKLNYLDIKHRLEQFLSLQEMSDQPLLWKQRSLKENDLPSDGLRITVKNIFGF